MINNSKLIKMFFSIMLLLIFFTCPLKAQDDSQFDAIGFYRDFFSDISNKRYGTAWNVLSEASKDVVSKQIAEVTKGNSTVLQIRKMMDTDEKGIRTAFFSSFDQNLQGISNYFKDAKYSQKCVSPRIYCYYHT